MKASEALIAAIKEVHPTERLNAAKVAERVFFEYLAKLREFNDYDEATNIEMATFAAIAEISYGFS